MKARIIFVGVALLGMGCSGKSTTPDTPVVFDSNVAALPALPSNPASAAPLQDALNAPNRTLPAIATVTTSQNQQFALSSNTVTTVAWSVDGVAGGNSSIGTISASGLFVPSATPGIHSIQATNTTDKSTLGQGAVAVTDLAGVFTYHNDKARTGQNLQEYGLTPITVASGKFGKRWSCAVDGDVYARPPLYIKSKNRRNCT